MPASCTRAQNGSNWGADGLRGPVWVHTGAGRMQMPIAMQSVILGGNVRVGLEDSIWAGKGRLAASNAEQVGIARKLVEDLGMEIATPDEARAMLNLKGGSDVDF